MTQQSNADTGTPSRAARNNRDSSVQDFLDRFARALTAGDGKAIATMWAVPAYVIGDEMVKVVSTADEVEQFFSGAKQQYNDRGISDTRAEILRLEWMTDHLVMVDVRWPYLDERGQEVGSESSTYTLQRAGEGGELRLRIALMRGVSAPH